MEASISNSPRRNGPGRFRSVFQPAIIRLYKIAGIVALSAILVGLIAFVTVNVFYFFNRTWVRPVILSPSHQKVIEASSELADARLRATELDSQRIETRASLAEIDRLVATDDKYLRDVAPLAEREGLRSVNGAMLRRQIDEATIERADALDKKVTMTQRLKELDGRIDEQRHVLERMGLSPYIKAMTQQVTVAFVPYQNLSNVRPGTALYGCSWGLVGCGKVGKVLRLIEGEVQDVHPHDNSFQRGVMVEVELTDETAGEDKVLFAGKKPLWFL
jgi:hypothetical protein